jgi:exopolyphosphatase/guanosine-5'-triphosphate,3'-diphosphate pyrophosphatase
MKRFDTSDQARVGVIDLGSNTVLLLVLERGDRVVLERSRITRLGRGVFASGRLDPARAELTRGVVREFAEAARNAGAAVVVAVGTEALRRAQDGPPFLAALRAEAALDAVRLLSGEDEARFAIEASRRSAADPARLVVVDVGGGSTELAWTDAEGRVRGTSLPLGTVRLTEAWVRCDPPLPAELDALRRAVSAEIGQLALELREREVVAVAGTATTLAALELELEPYDPERVEGFRMSAAQLAGWIERLAPMTVARRRALPGMESGREDVILAGLIVLQESLLALRSDALRVSGRGVRHGVALSLLEEETALW